MDDQMKSWLEWQMADWEELAPQTDRVRLTPVGLETPALGYIAQFDCRGLIRSYDGAVSEFETFLVGIRFGENHLRERPDPLRLVYLLSPANTWHPNVRCPALCVGHVKAGCGLIDLLYQVYGILTYQNFHLADCLNEQAAAWARNNLDRFPVDRRPLKRRADVVDERGAA